MNPILKYIMKIVRTVAFSLVFLLSLNKASLACNLLGINIGGDKSEIEKYFGTTEVDIGERDIDIEEDNEDELNDIITVSIGTDIFCPDINLGNSIMHAFIVNDKIAGVSIEVVNGTNNEESKKQLLYNYVIVNYGGIDNSSSPTWTGYKTWSIGSREIIYTKMYYRENFLIEELQITNPEYRSYIIDNEPNDE